MHSRNLGTNEKNFDLEHFLADFSYLKIPKWCFKYGGSVASLINESLIVEVESSSPENDLIPFIIFYVPIRFTIVGDLVGINY